MKKILFVVAVISFGFCSSSFAKDKVVIIPLSADVAGTDKQVQYNNEHMKPPRPADEGYPQL